MYLLNNFLNLLSTQRKFETSEAFKIITRVGITFCLYKSLSTWWNFCELDIEWKFTPCEFVFISAALSMTSYCGIIPLNS